MKKFVTYSEKVPGSGVYNFKTYRREYKWIEHRPMWNYWGLGGMRTFCGIKKTTYSLNHCYESAFNCPVCIKRAKYLGFLYPLSIKLDKLRKTVYYLIDDIKYKIFRK